MTVQHYYRGWRDQTWRTPKDLFQALHAEYSFTLDGAANAENALTSEYLTQEDLFQSWNRQRVFCNPPWSKIPEFIEKAAFAELAVLLVPARVNARWFHRALELGAEVRFFEGRPQFRIDDGRPGASSVDCLLLVFTH